MNGYQHGQSVAFCGVRNADEGVTQGCSLNRRRWLQLAGASLPFLGSDSLFAGESTGRWDDESIQEYSLKLINWLRDNFDSRARLLAQHTGEAFDPKYDYLAPTEDRRKLRMLEKFEEQRLSRRAAEEHIGRSLVELERVRAALARAEEKAAKTWKAASETVGIRDGRVYDTAISAGRLAVILDSSRSMTPYLKALRDEIARDFPDAYFVEVNGCHLDRHDSVPWFYAAPVSGVNPFTPDRHIPRVPQWDDDPYSRFIGWTRALPSAVTAMADLMHADAIYWFCDFDDDDDDEVIKSLARNLLAKKIKLYVHTVDERPPSLISLLAEKSGGEVIRKKL